jgi:hypothetical protein
VVLVGAAIIAIDSVRNGVVALRRSAKLPFEHGTRTILFGVLALIAVAAWIGALNLLVYAMAEPVAPGFVNVLVQLFLWCCLSGQVVMLSTVGSASSFREHDETTGQSTSAQRDDNVSNSPRIFDSMTNYARHHSSPTMASSAQLTFSRPERWTVHVSWICLICCPMMVAVLAKIGVVGAPERLAGPILFLANMLQLRAVWILNQSV